MSRTDCFMAIVDFHLILASIWLITLICQIFNLLNYLERVFSHLVTLSLNCLPENPLTLFTLTTTVTSLSPPQQGQCLATSLPPLEEALSPQGTLWSSWGTSLSSSRWDRSSSRTQPYYQPCCSSWAGTTHSCCRYHTSLLTTQQWVSGGDFSLSAYL